MCAECAFFGKKNLKLPHLHVLISKMPPFNNNNNFFLKKKKKKKGNRGGHSNPMGPFGGGSATPLAKSLLYSN
jgi:hypothetical protein